MLATSFHRPSGTRSRYISGSVSASGRPLPALVMLPRVVSLIRGGSPMPTECSASEMDFGRAGGRRVVADFDGGLVSSDAGALLLAETDKAIPRHRSGQQVGG